MKASADKTFPNAKTFATFGGKRGVASRLQAFAVERGLDEVASLCSPVLAGPDAVDARPATR